MRNSKLTIVVHALVAGAALLTGRALPEAPAPDIKREDAIRFIAAGIEHAHEQFRCGEATVTTSDFVPKELATVIRSMSQEGPPPSSQQNFQQQDQEFVTVGHWYYNDPLLSMSVESSVRPGGGPPDRLRLVIKDGVAKTLANTIVSSPRTIGPEPPRYNGAMSPPEDVLLRGLLWMEGSEVDPRNYTWFAVGPMSETLIDMLLKGRTAAVYMGKKRVEGVDCMVVERTWPGTQKETFWFDVEHGFLVRRREASLYMGGKWALAVETRVPRVIESEGIWLPESVETKDWSLSMADAVNKPADNEKPSPAAGPAPEAEGKDHHRPHVTVVTISNFRANCELPPEAFVLDWPLGTVVSDNIHHKRFRVSATNMTPYP